MNIGQRVVMLLVLILVTLFMAMPRKAAGDEINEVLHKYTQIECLARNVYHEAGGESLLGKKAVAQVTINRAKSKKYPMSICEVVTHKTKTRSGKVVCQFSWYCDKRKLNAELDPKLWEISLQVARQMIERGSNKLPAAIKRATHFHNTKVAPNWNLRHAGQVGNHIFYF